jgi:prolyl 4-hydroxylase
MKQTQITEDIILVEDFFTAQECEHYILWSEQQGYEEAKVQTSTGQVMMKNLRNNSRIMFSDELLAEKIWSKIQPFCIQNVGNSVAIGLNEMFRFYKYEVGQKFKRHIDGSYQRNETEFSCYTLLMYLNQDFEGGETVFGDIIIHPKIGSALIFKHQLKHEGKEILQGEKYVLRTDIMYRFEENKQEI